MNMEIYTPDVQKYIKYYTDQAAGRNRCKKTIQVGGISMGARRSNKQYFVISPSEQVVKQAEALMETPTIKRKAQPKRIIKSTKRRRVNKQKKTQLG